MSYEGHEQHLCRRGHLWEIPCSFEDAIERCPHCGAESRWRNDVDDTNGDASGTILPEGWASLRLTNEQTEVCNLGHRHLIKPSTYRVPSEDELFVLRHYWDMDRWRPMNSLESP